jgi:hypothetical protein
MTDVETIDGFGIPKRELTQEEATREITFERIQDFHMSAGEDYLDTCSLDSQAEKIFLGFLMAKRPDLSTEILSVANGSGEYRYINSEFYELFEETHGVYSGDAFYKLFAEFANLTGGLKKRINQVLIQVQEYYK